MATVVAFEATHLHPLEARRTAAAKGHQILGIVDRRRNDLH